MTGSMTHGDRANGKGKEAGPKRMGFFLIPDFSMIALISAFRASRFSDRAGAVLNRSSSRKCLASAASQNRSQIAPPATAMLM